MTLARPRDRRATIVATAAQLFAARGFDAVGIDDIGAAVGISGPAVYKHVAGKDALLVEIVTGVTRRAGDAVEAAVAEEPDPEVALRRVASALLDDADSLVTLVHGVGRLAAVGALADWVVLYGRVDAGWTHLQARLVPSMGAAAALLRRSAMLGPIIAAAGATGSVPRPRLDALCAAAVTGVLAAAEAPPSPPRPEPATWRPPVSRRDDIVRAAVPLFRERGFANVRMADVAAAAGLSAPALYHWFPGKTEILVEATERAGRRLWVRIDDAIAGAHSAGDALERLVLSLAAVVLDDRDVGFSAVGPEFLLLPEADQARLGRLHRDIEDRWTAVVQEVAPALDDDEARVVVSIVFWTVFQAVAGAAGAAERLDDIAAMAVGAVERIATLPRA